MPRARSRGSDRALRRGDDQSAGEGCSGGAGRCDPPHRPPRARVTRRPQRRARGLQGPRGRAGVPRPGRARPRARDRGPARGPAALVRDPAAGRRGLHQRGTRTCGNLGPHLTCTAKRHPARSGTAQGERMSTDRLLGAPIAGPGSGSPLSGPGVTAPSLSGASSRFLSDILVELGFVTETHADEAVQTARNPGQPTPEKVLLASGGISEDQLARALAERYGLEHIDLVEFPVDTSAAGLLRKTAAKRYLAAPVGFADDGALVLAVADPGDALGLSDIAVMTKLAVRPAVAARSQIVKLLDTLAFMEEPAPGESRSLSTVIVPPDDSASGDPPAADGGEPVPVDAPAPAAPDEATEKELARLREELDLALVARDQAEVEAASTGRHAESAAQREREETLEALRAEHERILATSEHAAEEALRAERTSAQQALASLRANHEEALAELRSEHQAAIAELKAAHGEAVEGLKATHDHELRAERARRVEEVEAERARTAAAIDAERERTDKELEALRKRAGAALEEEQARHEQALADEQARHEQALDDQRARHEAALELAAAGSPDDAERLKRLERELAVARDQTELTADADRRAEGARAALSALRDESERQAQVHALTERELRAELKKLRAELPEASHK